MKKVLHVLYSTASYAIFFATILYLIGFAENVFVPKSIDSGDEMDMTAAFLINLGLVSLFGIQHNIIARQSLKKKLSSLLPESIERSTHVLFASVMVILLLYFWKPIPYIIWNFSNSIAGYVLLVISFLGWGLLLLSVFFVNHFHLFGLQQVYRYSNGKEQFALPFRMPPLCWKMRNLTYVGFLIAFWAAPVVTVGHLMFSISMTIYIFIGVYHEERDLVSLYGADYRLYQQRTSKLSSFTKYCS